MGSVSDQSKTPMFGHVDEATAYVVDDYPYGYRVRTSIRYWIETTKNGDRMVSQTLNPKTDRWNKPKKSTYSEVGYLTVDDENGHVGWVGVSGYSGVEATEAFVVATEGHLSEAQKRKLAWVIGLQKALENVSFSVVETTQETPEEAAVRDAEERKVMGYLNRRANVEAAAALEGLG